ncbi:hypothetical protein QL285_059365 [Trifolium repens]|nr:hypothetical protein QL285_059365 [Trifolium repens]
MGNNLHGASLQTLHFPYHIQLGRYATIDIQKEELSPDMAHIPLKKWIMSYKVDGSNCRLKVEKLFTTNQCFKNRTGARTGVATGSRVNRSDRFNRYRTG